MKGKSIGVVALLAVAAVAVVYLIYRIVAALLGLLNGAIDIVIGLVFIVGLAALVIWMFAYAKRKRK